MDVLIVASTWLYTKLALIVNFKWYACKKCTSSLKSVVILSAFIHSYSFISLYDTPQQTTLVTLKLRKEYLNTVTYNIAVLLRIKYWTLWYIERYCMLTYTGVTNFQKTVRFFWPTLYIHFGVFSVHSVVVWSVIIFQQKIINYCKHLSSRLAVAFVTLVNKFRSLHFIDVTFYFLQLTHWYYIDICLTIALL